MFCHQRAEQALLNLLTNGSCQLFKTVGAINIFFEFSHVGQTLSSANSQHMRGTREQTRAECCLWMQSSLKVSHPVPVEKQNFGSFCVLPGRLLSPSFLFPPFSPSPPPPVCSCCWICPLFRWLVAMLLSSLCSLALWWIVYGFPSSILHFCIDGLGFE